MKKELVSILLIFSIFLVNGLTINEPEDVYQLGDKLFVTATELKGQDTGNLNIDLICSNSTVNLLKISARAFSAEGGQSYSIPYKLLTREDLEIDDLRSVVGDCYISANLASEIVTTKHFIISDTLKIDVNSDKVKYNPGDTLVLSLETKRADGGAFNGFYEISNFTDLSGNISEGSEDIEIEITNNIRPGKYFLNLDVYDVDVNGEYLNNGSESIFVVVNQVATTVESAVSSLEVVPGDTLRLNPSVLDQSGGLMNGSIAVHVNDPDGNKYDYSATSGETLDIPFATNSAKGTWQVYVTSANLVDESEISVLGVERVNYSFDNSVLSITNIGNVDYFGEAEIKIGEKIESVEVKLKKGETKDFILEAPEGEYEISVNDGESSYSGSGFLTGNAINIREVGSSGIIRGLSLMWIFLIFLVGGLGFVMIGMYKKTKVVGTKISFKEKVKGWGGKFKPIIPKRKEKRDDMVDFTSQKKISHAESALVLNGEKVNSSIVSIKIDDKDMFNEEIQKEIITTIKNSSGSKGVVDVKEDFIYIIYSPLITRSFKNDLLAVSSALQIKSRLDTFKKNMKGELEYGIGVHNGDLVSEKTKDTLKYTGIGNTLTFSNKIASETKNEVFVSEKIRRSLLRNVKITEIKEIEENKIYNVTDLVNRDEDRAKLKELLRRMDT